jgi:hypothetical protein
VSERLLSSRRLAHSGGLRSSNALVRGLVETLSNSDKLVASGLELLDDVGKKIVGSGSWRDSRRSTISRTYFACAE